jgi:holo-[acyl-carrier protein] synthase
LSAVRVQGDRAHAVQSLPAIPEVPGPSVSRVVGTDIVEIAQIAESRAKFGDRYLKRVFTEQEIAYSTADGRRPDEHLAARFAAKEATIKALRAGAVAVDWRWIEVERRADGYCALVLHGDMRRLARRRGVSDLCVSMSHDGSYAVAVVVGTVAGTPGARGAAEPGRAHREPSKSNRRHYRT